MLKYKQGVNILEMLKSKGYSSTRLRNEKILGQKTLTALRNGEMIGIKSLERICDILNCQPGKLIEHIPNNKAE